MGACWLLAAWVKYLKSKGTDLFRGLRRQQTEVPYYLRSEKNKKPRLSLNGNRHLFNDDLADSPELPEPRRLKLDALSCLIAAVVLLAWSQFG